MKSRLFVVDEKSLKETREKNIASIAIVDSIQLELLVVVS